MFPHVVKSSCTPACQSHLYSWSVRAKLRRQICSSSHTLANMDGKILQTEVCVLKHIAKTGGNSLYSHNSCRFSSSAVGYKVKDDLKDCFTLLGLTDPCTPEELRDAYFEKAKLYHPDSKSPTADAGKFEQVKDAYRSIKIRLQSEIPELEVEDIDEEMDFTRRQPQHRQYLSFQGIGTGTMSQRQKQYEQHKVSRAMENMYKYKFRQITPEGESALVTKDKKATRKRKIYNAIDRLVEDLIQESMSRGDFDNLKGAGKPQTFSDGYHYIDNTMVKLNNIMKNDDLVPDWIDMAKEIRTDVNKLREKLAKETQRYKYKAFFNDDVREKHWDSYVEKYRIGLMDVNLKIDKYNLIVPILNKQMTHFDFDREFNRVHDNYTAYLPRNYYEQEKIRHRRMDASRISLSISWKEFWENIRGSWKS